MQSKSIIQNDWKSFNLNGKVKSLSKTSYFAIEKNGEIFKDKKGSDEFYHLDLTLLFDNKGLLLELNWFNTKGVLVEKHIYKYDKIGNQIESNIYNSKGRLLGNSTFLYDSDRNCIEVNDYDSKGKLINNYVTKGNDLDETKIGSGTKSNTINKYNDEGKLIEVTSLNADDSPDCKFTIKYDDQDKMIEENCYNIEGSPISSRTFKYYHDKNGNWTKQIKFINGIPKCIVEREIVYF